MGISDRPVPELDGLRGVAILLVLLHHYVFAQVAAPASSTLAYANAALRLTWSGVDLFFVLSGFLIGGILIDNKGSRSLARTFWVRRACRVIPLYAVSLGVFALGVWLGMERFVPWLFAAPLPLLSYSTFTQNWAMTSTGTFGAGWMGVTWSLAVEEQLYLCSALIILLMPRVRTIATIVMLIALAPLARSAAPWPGSFVFTLCRCDAMLAGVLSAYLVRHDLWIEQARAIRVLLLSAIAASVPLLAAYTLVRATDAATFSIVALCWACLLLLTFQQQGTAWARPARLHWLGWFGRRSFGLYLLHQPLSGIGHAVLLDRSPLMDSWPSALVTLGLFVLLLGCAEATFRLIEAPFQRLGRRWSYRAAIAPPPVVLAAT